MADEYQISSLDYGSMFDHAALDPAARGRPTSTTQVLLPPYNRAVEHEPTHLLASKLPLGAY
jgi:hypothetical protein